MSFPFTLIAGPCVIEEKSILFEIAEEVSEICDDLKIKFIFKASFDKANRSSINSFRGPGIDKGLDVLSEIKQKYGVKLLTDIHESWQAKPVSDIVDTLQIPAYLCRQTDLLLAAVKAIEETQKSINIKKGQFLAPWDMKQVLNKINQAGITCDSNRIWLTERGTCFGYNTLVVDYRSLPELRKLKCPVIFDATHSVQQPGGKGSSSGGQREHVATLSRAAVAVGVDGLFMEVHPDPDKALSDGPNMVPLHRLRDLLEELMRIRNTKKLGESSSTY